MENNEVNAQKKFIDFVCGKFDELKDLFLSKNLQYRTSSDPLANFRAGARLRAGKSTLAEMYEEAKNYRRKHVVHIERHGIDAEKAVESLMDTAVYSVIMAYLIKLAEDDGDI